MTIACWHAWLFMWACIPATISLVPWAVLSGHHSTCLVEREDLPSPLCKGAIRECRVLYCNSLQCLTALSRGWWQQMVAWPTCSREFQCGWVSTSLWLFGERRWLSSVPRLWGPILRQLCVSHSTHCYRSQEPANETPQRRSCPNCHPSTREEKCKTRTSTTVLSL